MAQQYVMCDVGGTPQIQILHQVPGVSVVVLTHVRSYLISTYYLFVLQNFTNQFVPKFLQHIGMDCSRGSGWGDEYSTPEHLGRLLLQTTTCWLKPATAVYYYCVCVES